MVEFCEDTPTSAKQVTEVFTIYKTVDKKVKPVPGTVPDSMNHFQRPHVDLAFTPNSSTRIYAHYTANCGAYGWVEG